MDIQLNFVNDSKDLNETQVVIFQKNSFTDNTGVVAWLVIQHCGTGEHHPFVYPTEMQVASSDSYGNYTPSLDAEPGQAFAVVLTHSGETLFHTGDANYPDEVQISNQLQQGAISADVFRDGKLLATKTSVAPGEMAAFAFKPTLWIGAASQVEQGKILDSAAVENVNTELPLLGIASADIVMTGGGPGINSMPFAFTLQNVVHA